MDESTASPTHLDGREAHVLESHDGRLRAMLVPELAMLCWSLTFDGHEFLAHPNDITAFASSWATTGVPLLHPWANRLGGTRLVGVAVDTITESPLIPRDANRLPIHGLNLADAGWRVQARSTASIRASLAFSDPARLAIFPFAHEISVTAALRGHALEVTTEVAATGGTPVPIAFGWHPYLRLPGVSRSAWHVGLPVRRRAILDARMLPTGREERVAIPDGRLGERSYDDLFTQLDPAPRFTLSGGGWRVAVGFGEGYPFAQVYAPAGADLIAFEPMTAPGNAVVDGRFLRVLPAGDMFSATFRIELARDATSRST